MKVDPNAPAYPVFDSYGKLLHTGLPARLEIAARVLGAVDMESSSFDYTDAIERVAVRALEFADALIAAHNATETKT